MVAEIARKNNTAFISIIYPHQGVFFQEKFSDMGQMLLKVKI